MNTDQGTDERGWRCFHCGETFVETCEARAHFGDDEGATPACLHGGPRGLLKALRKATSRLRRADAEIETLEHGVLAAADLAYFDGATSLHEARHAFESVEGRALAAEAIVEDIRRRWPALVEASRRRVGGGWRKP